MSDCMKCDFGTGACTCGREAAISQVPAPWDCSGSEERTKLVIIPLFAICESIHGNWHYHLFNRKTGKASEALCGAKTMWSGAPLDTWGFKPEHMPSSYCEDCERISQASDGGEH